MSMTPHFLSTEVTAKTLRITRSQLQNLFPYIPYLFVPKRSVRLFPATYIKAFAKFMEDEHCTKATVALALNFWRLEESRQLVIAQQGLVTNSLDTTQHYTAAQLMELLSIARMTVTNWAQGAVFKIERVGRDLRIPSSELRAALVWRTPR